MLAWQHVPLSPLQTPSAKLAVGVLLEKTLIGSLSPEILREMHQVLDEHLKTGKTPGISTVQMQRIFKVLGRSAEIEGKNR